MLHSPYWRDRTFSGGEISLSPGSASIQPVPPVPVNAELVYVPPKTTRQGSDSREKRRNSSTGSLHSEVLSDPTSTTTAQSESAEPKALRRISRITEDTSSLPNTPQPPDSDLKNKKVEAEDAKQSSNHSSSSVLTSEPGLSRHLSTKRESESYSEGVTSPGYSPVSEAPSSAKDIDHVLRYYSDAVSPEPGDRNFRLPFSPISEESISQLSPPTPFRGDSKRNVTSGRLFLGTSASPSSPAGKATFTYVFAIYLYTFYRSS
jgi:hypothetical protein